MISYPLRLSCWLSATFLLPLLAAASGHGSGSMIDQLPARPSQYVLRDWRDVTLKYDALISNFDATG